MDLTSLDFLKLIFPIGIFMLGFASFLAGLWILITGAMGRDIRTIATQTTRLVQKGIAEEVSGLVGNASTLLNALNDLSRTSTGIGIFLMIVGALMMAGGVLFLFQAI